MVVLVIVLAVVTVVAVVLAAVWRNGLGTQRRLTTEVEAAKMEQERRDGRSWREMEQWVKGGRSGLRIWTFRQRLLPKGSV